MRTIPLLLAAVLAACRPAPPGGPAYEPPAGKRAFALVVDKSQARFLVPGDAVEVVLIVDTTRPDAEVESRSEVLAPRAEVLRVKNDWSGQTGLVALALSPEESQIAALAVDREDRLFLNKTAPGPAALKRLTLPPPPPRLSGDLRGIAALAYPDQQEFLAPGDRVDVIAARRGYKAGGKSELTAHTILQDVVVLRAAPPDGEEDWATVQLLLDPAQAAALSRSMTAEEHLALPVRAQDDRQTRPVEPAKMSRKVGLEAERAATRL